MVADAFQRQIRSLGIEEVESVLSKHLGHKYSKTDDIWNKIGPYVGKATATSRAISLNETLVTPIDYFSLRYSTGMHLLIDKVSELKRSNAVKMEDEKKWKTSR
ncbi:MAG: hypothetical protein LBS92_04455 [Candidatus Methanoplasma sp.]|jgi:hypothetical protein|nr:hypothetical protein [Candidatus Methanoplasma sp.]